jgi:hypothetical protein
MIVYVIRKMAFSTTAVPSSSSIFSFNPNAGVGPAGPPGPTGPSGALGLVIGQSDPLGFIEYGPLAWAPLNGFDLGGGSNLTGGFNLHMFPYLLPVTSLSGIMIDPSVANTGGDIRVALYRGDGFQNTPGTLLDEGPITTIGAGTVPVTIPLSGVVNITTPGIYYVALVGDNTIVSDNFLYRYSDLIPNRDLTQPSTHNCFRVDLTFDALTGGYPTTVVPGSPGIMDGPEWEQFLFINSFRALS